MAGQVGGTGNVGRAQPAGSGASNIKYLGIGNNKIKIIRINEDVMLLENVNSKNINLLRKRFPGLADGSWLLLDDGKNKTRRMLIKAEVYKSSDFWANMKSYWESGDAKKDIRNFSKTGKAIVDAANHAADYSDKKINEACKFLYPNEFCIGLTNSTNRLITNRLKLIRLIKKEEYKELAREYFRAQSLLNNKKSLLRGEEKVLIEDIIDFLNAVLENDLQLAIKVRNILIKQYKMNPKDIGF